MIRFSFIIPVYNAEKTIERCVNSIEKNNCSDVEIILIEDCSKDNSLAICKRLSEKYDNVICLNNKVNKGVSYTRNKGLQEAKGEYLLFADSDDWIESNYIDTFRSVADNYNVDLAVCGYVNHDERQNGRIDNYGWKDFEGYKEISWKTEIKFLYDARLLQQLWNKMFRTKYIKENNIIFDESINIGEDTRFILSYLKCCQSPNAVLINEPLYHYMRDQDGSLMFNIGYESVEEPLKNLRMLYELEGVPALDIDKQIDEDRKKQIESYAYLIMHNIAMSDKEKKKLILALDPIKGKKLYVKNRKTYFKERISKFIRK